MTIYLKHIEGSKNGQIEFFDGESIRLGRLPDNDVQFDPKEFASVSGHHAEIYNNDGLFFIKDLNSTNGTLVNSQKITQPIQLQDDDVIQLSARGPKLDFSTRDPAAGNKTFVDPAQTVVLPRPPTDITSPAPDYKTKILEKIRPNLPMLYGGVGMNAFVGIGLYLGFPWGWVLLYASVAMLLAGGAYLGWRMWMARKKTASPGPIPIGASGEMQRKWVKVARALRESKLQRPGEDPLYALPWCLMLGESGSGKSLLANSAGPLTSVKTEGQSGPTLNCDWWFYDKLVVLDTAGHFANQGKEQQNGKEWQDLIALLKTHRGREPLNGVVITLGADALISGSPEKLKERALPIRERLADLIYRLGVSFPIYLLISKCDLIKGFNEFWSVLPNQAHGQAFGQINKDYATGNTTPAFFDNAFRSIVEKVEQFRIAAYYELKDTESAPGTFLFPAELKSLRAPLKAFVDTLFQPTPYREVPVLRGLFFTSVNPSGAPLSRVAHLLGVDIPPGEPHGGSRDMFVRDLFSTILPNDRPLVGRTATGKERYRIRRTAGWIFVASAAFLVCGLLAISFTKNWLLLQRLEIGPCNEIAVGGGAIGQALRPLDDCRQSIEGLLPQTFLQNVAMLFGRDRSKRVAAALQEKFLLGFRTNVSDPIDSRIDQSLSGNSGDPMVLGSVIQRYRLVGRCQDGGCPDLIETDALNYKVLLAVAQPGLDSADPTVTRLRHSHNAYLRWQPDAAVYRGMQSKDMVRITRWLASGLKEDKILESAKAQFAPIRAATFWDMEMPGQVSAAYTARAWREGLLPLITGLRSIATNSNDVSELVTDFESHYRQTALHEWLVFLTNFPEGEKLLLQKAAGRQIMVNSASGDSPYHRAVNSAYDNLSVVLGDSWQRGDLPVWTGTLKKYGALKAKLKEAEKGAKTAFQETPQGKDGNAEKYLSAYLTSLSQVRVELNTTEKSFTSAKKAFEEAEAGSGASHPVLKAEWALKALKDKIESPRGEDRLIWILLRRPIILAWKAMLDESGKYLQTQWEGLLLEVRDLDPGPKGSKIMAFVTGSTTAFLSRQGGVWMAKRVLEQSVPFTDQFMHYLVRLRIEAIRPGGGDSTSFPSPLPSELQPPPFIVRTS